MKSVVLQYFDWENGVLKSKLVEIQNKPKETADSFDIYIRNSLQSKGLLQKRIAFAGDDRCIMLGGL